MKLISVLISLSGGVVCLGLVGCFEPATHLSLDRREAGNTPDGREPTGQPRPSVPALSGNLQLVGSGAVLSQSQQFKAYQSTSSLSGGIAEGTLYRWSAPELSLGLQQGGPQGGAP